MIGCADFERSRGTQPSSEAPRSSADRRPAVGDVLHLDLSAGCGDGARGEHDAVGRRVEGPLVAENGIAVDKDGHVARALGRERQAEVRLWPAGATEDL